MGEYLNDSIIVKLASSNDDNVLQNKQVNQFVDEGVDLLVISPNQLSADFQGGVERAYEKGIPVILYDRILPIPINILHSSAVTTIISVSQWVPL